MKDSLLIVFVVFVAAFFGTTAAMLVDVQVRPRYEPAERIVPIPVQPYRSHRYFWKDREEVAPPPFAPEADEPIPAA